MRTQHDPLAVHSLGECHDALWWPNLTVALVVVPNWPVTKLFRPNVHCKWISVGAKWRQQLHTDDPNCMTGADRGNWNNQAVIN